MDSRAKQRLTGAVILVALFVLLVPELLTGPRNAGGDAPNEEGMRRYTIDLDASAGNGQPMAPAQPAGAVALPPVAENPRPDNRVADTRAIAGEAAQPEPAAPSVSPAPTPAVVTPMAPPPQTVATAPAPSALPSKPVATPPKPATTPAPSTRAADSPCSSAASSAARTPNDWFEK